MPTLKFNYTQFTHKEGAKTFTGEALSREEYSTFTPQRLGLGDISIEGQPIQALAAVFNLQGFTKFCNQPDAQLVIPEFLEAYLNWHFKELAAQMKEREADGAIRLWCRFPFFVKFLGDGLLFLWNTAGLGKTELSILAMSAQEILDEYKQTFLPDIRKRVSLPPPALRCGLARGQIMAVGNGEDFVGPCINIASRLHKLGPLSFAVARRGMNFHDTNNDFWKEFDVKKVHLNGVGDNELVYVRLREFDALHPGEKANFHEP